MPAMPAITSTSGHAAEVEFEADHDSVSRCSKEDHPYARPTMHKHATGSANPRAAGTFVKSFRDRVIQIEIFKSSLNPSVCVDFLKVVVD